MPRRKLTPQLGDHLRTLRESARLSMEGVRRRLADRGISFAVSALSRMEKKGRPPRAEVLEALAELYGAPADDLFGRLYKELGVDLRSVNAAQTFRSRSAEQASETNPAPGEYQGEIRTSDQEEAEAEYRPDHTSRGVEHGSFVAVASSRPSDQELDALTDLIADITQKVDAIAIVRDQLVDWAATLADIKADRARQAVTRTPRGPRRHRGPAPPETA